MQQLAEQLESHQCPKHGSPLCFVYKGVVQNNESRMMCDECINPKNANQLINIKKAFRFLGEQQVQQINQIYQEKARLWHKFKHNQVQILEMLNDLEVHVIDIINSISENGVITIMNQQFLNKLTTQQHIKSLGQQLSSLIDTDNDGKYKFKLKQVQPFVDQCVSQCGELVKVQKRVIEELSQNQIQQTQQLKVKENKVYVDNSKYFYETTQTLQLTNFIFWLCFNLDETQIIAASGDFILMFQLSLQGSWYQVEFSSVGHNGQIWKVQFNHNSTLIASCSSDKMIFIWNKQLDGKWCIQDKLSSHKDIVYSVCFNHDSTLLASGSVDKTIIIHALKNGKWIISEVLSEHTNNVSDVCFNHNSTLLASASDIIILWQMNNQGKWKVKQKLYGHPEGVLRIQFNQDSTQLISASMDKTINIYSVDQDGVWISMQTLSGHEDRVNSAYMNKQSNLIVSGSNDKSIKIWKLDNEHKWECTQTILQHTHYVYCSIISSDSSMIISGSGDNTIKVHKRKLIR